MNQFSVGGEDVLWGRKTSFVWERDITQIKSKLRLCGKAEKEEFEGFSNKSRVFPFL